jgi:glycosyltransferase involved in cell wall biosynthesis
MVNAVRPLRVCYFGAYRAGYSRNQIMIEGLRRSGVEVAECHERLWRGIEDRVQTASGGWLKPAFVARLLRTYGRLLIAYRGVGDYDVMVLGYPGQLDVFLARVLTWLRCKPLVLDVFMSLYLIAFERGLTERHPLTGRLIYGLEKLACLLPERLILDTAEYVAWFGQTYRLGAERFALVPTGADDRFFHPVAASGRDDGLFRAVYYGTFIPNHGTEYIVEAARILVEHAPSVRVELIGEGPAKARAVALAQAYGLENVHFAGWVDKQELACKVAEADVCLGVFGTTPQSMMTVQNKIYEALAMGKPLITGESPTVRAALADGEQVLLCAREDPQSLADALLRLMEHPELRERLAKQGYERYAQAFTPDALGRQARIHLEALVG